MVIEGMRWSLRGGGGHRGDKVVIEGTRWSLRGHGGH